MRRACCLRVTASFEGSRFPVLRRQFNPPKTASSGVTAVHASEKEVAIRLDYPLYCFEHHAAHARPYDLRMATVPLHEFIGVYREEIIRRCKEKVAGRSSPPAPADAEIDHGVPLFLDQLVQELRDGPSKSHAISRDAGEHGHDLLRKGFTVSQVVHDYGDVCQSVTDLAVELDAPISTEDFRTLNRCLDDAIASAVTDYSRNQDVARDGESSELRNLINTAITAFEVLQTGTVGIAGKTGGVVHRSLTAIRALSERSLADAAKPTSTRT